MLPDSTRRKDAEISRQQLEWDRSSEVRRDKDTSSVNPHSIVAVDRVVNGRAAGWDEGVMDMTLGEKSILTISRYV